MLIRLAQTRRFRARWTEDINREWVNALLQARSDLTREQLDRTVDLMSKAVPGCMVSGYEPLIEGLELPDPNDRHVLAAAIRCGAAAIVTTNLKDFPPEYLDKFEKFARHPDDFIMDLADLEPQLIEVIAKQQRAELTDPKVSVEDFIATLKRQGLVQVATFLTDRSDLL